MEKVLKHLFQKWPHVPKNILIDPVQHVMVTVKSEHKVVFFQWRELVEGVAVLVKKSKVNVVNAQILEE